MPRQFPCADAAACLPGLLPCRVAGGRRFLPDAHFGSLHCRLGLCRGHYAACPLRRADLPLFGRGRRPERAADDLDLRTGGRLRRVGPEHGCRGCHGRSDAAPAAGASAPGRTVPGLLLHLPVGRHLRGNDRGAGPRGCGAFVRDGDERGLADGHRRGRRLLRRQPLVHLRHDDRRNPHTGVRPARQVPCQCAHCGPGGRGDAVGLSADGQRSRCRGGAGTGRVGPCAALPACAGNGHCRHERIEGAPAGHRRLGRDRPGDREFRPARVVRRHGTGHHRHG
ncbi:unknown [Alistipes sp. CAG:268]|nr:unknown [Alistipes sp. CAG:268]